MSKIIVIIDNHPNGKIWYEEHLLDFKRHNPYGPAYIEYYPNGQIKYKEYFMHGMRHNVHGYAYFSYDIQGNITCLRHWVAGYILEEEEFQNKIYLKLQIANKIGR